MESDFVDFSTICRTCLSNENLKPIFEYSEDKSCVSANLLSVTGVLINQNDDLPQNICVSCSILIQQTLEFKKQCKVNELQLLQQQERNLYNIKTETIQTEDSKINEKDKNFLQHKEKDEVEICFKKEESIDTSKDLNLKTNGIDNSCVDKVSKSTSKTKKKRKPDKNKTQKTFEADLPYIPNNTEPQDARNTRVTCKFCQKNLSIRSICIHIARCHLEGDMRREKCDLCDKVVTKEKMNRHKLLTHGLKGARCGYCKQEFKNRDSLVQHVVSCADKKKKRKASEAGRVLVECDVCQQTMQKSSLRMHKLVKHAGMGPVCEHCGLRVSNKLRLLEHYRARHGYDKLKCRFCDYQSAGVLAMANHERRHRGEKPFVCSCGAKFHAAYLLAQHKHSHRDQKLFKCSQCPASFKSSNSLRSHIQSCHSLTLHKCAVCARAYRCRHYAVRHMRHAHRHSGPVPPLETVPCGEVT